MDPDPLVALGAIRALTALLGAVIVVIALRAYRRSHARALLYFTTGVGIVTAGFAIEGFAFEILGLPLATVSAIEAVFTLAAFGLLVFSLFAKEQASLPPPSDAQG